jgi:hypothetical protein
LGKKKSPSPYPVSKAANLSDFQNGNDMGYGSVHSLHESLRCSPVETNGFEIFVSSVIIEA